MATHDYIISNASGAAVRSDLNNALAAIVSNNSSATEPTTTYAYMWWADTTAGQLKIRNSTDTDWVVINELDGTSLMEDGTVSAPGLAFADDLNTGFYRPGADSLGIATNGTNAIYIDSSQNVGIGTSVPSEILDAFGNIRFGSPNLGRIYSSDGSRGSIQISAPHDATNRAVSYGNNYYLNSSGNWVQEVTNIGGSAIELRASNGGYGEFLFRQKQDPDAGGAERIPFVIDTTGNVGIGTTSPQSKLTVDYGAISVTDVAGDGTDPGLYGAMWSEGATFTQAGYQIAFNTGNNSARTERARIDSSGRLLVGTSTAPGSAGSAPYALLQIEGNSYSGTGPGSIALRSGTASASIGSGGEVGQIAFAANDNEEFALIGCEADAATGSGDHPGRLVFKTTADNASSPTERMRIGSGGTIKVHGQMQFTDGASGNDKGAIQAFGDDFNNGNLRFYTKGSGSLDERMRLTSGGYLYCIGVYNAGIGGTTRDVYVENNGNIGYLTSIKASKTNISDLTELDWLWSLSPKTFNYRLKDEEGNYTDEANPETQYGLIAEEVEQVAPGICFYDVDEEGTQVLAGVQYSKLVTPLLKALQQANARIETLEAKVAALESA